MPLLGPKKLLIKIYAGKHYVETTYDQLGINRAVSFLQSLKLPAGQKRPEELKD